MASAVRPKQLFTVGALLLALAALFTPVALADNGGFTPVAPASDNADGIRDTFLFVSIFVVGIFVLVEVVLVAFVFRYRRRRRERFEDGAPVHGATKLELMWTAFPLVILIAIAVFVFVELPGIHDVPDAEAGGEGLEIEVSGRQFYWQYEYPNGVVAIDHLRIPANVPVRLEITAPDEDVIHSWWIPALAGKLDAIPGTVNTLAFEADRPGTYSGQCAELCGVVHAKMLATAEVLPENEFDAWLAERRADQSAVRPSSARRCGTASARSATATGARAASGRGSPAPPCSRTPGRSSRSCATDEERCPPSAPAGPTSRCAR